MNNTGKAFLETCSAAIGATALTPRERLVFLVVAWLGEDATRKDICAFTHVDQRNISRVIYSLKAKKLLQSEKAIVNMTENRQTDASISVDMTENRQTDDNKSVNMTKNRQTDDFSGLSPHPSINNINNNKRKEKNNACACEDDSFSSFWEKYPRKMGKPKVRAKWEALMAEGVDAKEILAGLQRSIQTWRETFDNIKFIPYPLKWLNEESWTDQDATDFKFEKKAPAVEKAPHEVVKPSTATSTPQPASFSEDEKAFLDVYGKKPHSKEDIELFHRAFQHAVEELKGDAKLLNAAAEIAIETHTLDEGDTRRMKRASYWLDDCDFRQYLTRARNSASYFKSTGKQPWRITFVD